ncbi:MAG TPA: metallopeptidase TldD-related protein [Bryobacteraceae bacterium]|nr:metallopeptidase TldD-related protein [Bryobacteraceae bacterium]
MRRRTFVLLAPAAFTGLRAQAPQDVVLQAMADELERSRSLRIMSSDLPYYIEYALYDGESCTVTATLGAIARSGRMRYRLPRVQVRVGDYQLDQTNYVGTDFSAGPRYDVESFPIDNSYSVLRHHLWLATDSAYRSAVEAFSRKRAALKNLSTAAQLSDFGPAEPLQLLLEARPRAYSEALWKARIKKLSGVFLEFPHVAHSSVDVDTSWTTHYIATSEGTRVRVPEGVTAITIRASAYAADGMPLRNSVVIHSLDPDRLPADAELERQARAVAQDLTALTQAPAGESYAGPVLFEGVAAAQMFAEVLGKNLAVPRRPVSNPGRPFPFVAGEFEGRIGARVLPEWVDVVDDPAQIEWQGRPLLGHYRVDLEGIAPPKLTLIEKGVLKNFLLTRQPVQGVSGSNGRARLYGMFGHKAAGFGNLFVRASQSVSRDTLRKKLIETCAQRGKPYGLIVRQMDFPSSAAFDEIRRLLAGSAGSSSGRVSLPVLVYRAYPDGREELVRGLKFRSLNARSLKDIAAASDESFVFDFLDHDAPFAVMGGASFVSETSVVAPSVLIDDVELEPLPTDYPRPPIVPAPQLK